MDEVSSPQQDTTHDWAIAVDADHLTRIRRDPATFAPGGLQHLLLEVIAYAADEVSVGSGGRSCHLPPRWLGIRVRQRSRHRHPS